jgi:hypothetical protein
LLALLELDERAPLTVERWFLRRNGLHVEHGHAYDPDNAPTHPLTVPTPRTEPLGVALNRRFLSPNQAFDFAHATEITPVEALARAVRVFGARMPLILARYFRESGKFCKDAGFHPAHLAELQAGDGLVAALAEETGLSADAIRAVLEDRPRPTHEDFVHALHQPYHRHILSSEALLDAGKRRGWEVVRYYDTMYNNTLIPTMNPRFVLHYVRCLDDVYDLVAEPIRANSWKLWSPVTAFYGLFGYFFDRHTDVQAIFRAP